MSPVFLRAHTQEERALSNGWGQVHQDYGGGDLLQHVRQIDGDGGDADAALHAEDRQDHRVEALSLGLVPVQKFGDTFEQLINVGGLGHVIVRAGCQRSLTVDGLSACREDDDAYPFGARVGAELFDHLVTAHTRHHHIDEGDVRRLVESCLQTFLSVRAGDNFVLSLFFQDHFEHAEHVIIVINDQDSGHRLPPRD